MIFRRANPLSVAASVAATGILLCAQTANADGTEKCDEEPTVASSTQVANVSYTNQVAPPSRHLTPLNRALFIGGTAAAGLGLGYAGYRFAECNGLNCASTRPKLDVTMDVVGWGLGGGALAMATYMYFTSGDGERQAPAMIGVGENGGLQMSFLGSF